MKKFLLLLFIIISLPVRANELTIILSSDGDGHTIAARVFGKYLASALSSDTRVVYRVVPGAAGIASTNYLYNRAPKDGNTIGIMFRNIPLVGAINKGDSNIMFDATKFVWLGSLTDGRQDAAILISNISNFENLAVGSENVISSNPIDFISKYTSLRLRKISGYSSSNSIRLAFLRSEIDAMITTMNSIQTYDKAWLNKYYPVVQFGNGINRHELLLNIPTLMEQVSDPIARQALEIYENQFALLRPYVAPPDIPTERAESLRNAFRVAVNNESFREEAKRINLEISPIYHIEASAIVRRTYSSSSNVLEILK